MSYKKVALFSIAVTALFTFFGCTQYWQYTNAKEMVFASADGNTYHTSECIYTNDESAEGMLIDAVSAGFTACPVCTPPQLTLKADQTALDFLDLASWALTLVGLVAGPFLIYKLRLRRKATEVARIKYTGDWDALTKDERKQIIADSRDTIDKQVSK